MSRLIVILLCLSACTSPSPEFRAANSKSVSIGGDEITVFVVPGKAQAIRTNYRNRKQRVDAVFRLVQAIETVTNCKVKRSSIKGDSVLITASLNC